jgi:N-acetylglucosaminyldiphosphoundecaprenol N-acetyl-beta-D-mannosaminyltransferase
MAKVKSPPIDAAPVSILGVPFDNVTIPQALARIEAMIASREPHYLVTANIDFLVNSLHDVELRRILFESDLVLCDGTPLLWISKLLGNPLPERVAGSDMAPLLVQLVAEKKYRLFFLGSSPEVAETASARLRKEHPGFELAGHYSPPFSSVLEMDHQEITRRIRAARPDILMVAFGSPKQEKWIGMHYRTLGVPVSIGVGATIDFLAGRFRRAPAWMRRTGTEWLFRMGQEPRRLFWRYAKDIRYFCAPMLRQLWRLQFNKHFSKGKPGRKMVQHCQNDWQEIQVPEWLDMETVRREAPLWEKITSSPFNSLLLLDQVQFIDSTGMGLLIRLRKKLHAAGRQLVLVAPSPAVSRALDAMQLSSFFDHAPDPGAARQSFAPVDHAEAVLHPGPFAAEQTLQWRGEITAASIEGIWDETENYIRCRAKLQHPLIIDLSQVRFLDSSGLGIMIRARKLAAKLEAPLEFTQPCPEVWNVIQLARLEGFLFHKNP